MLGRGKTMGWIEIFEPKHACLVGFCHLLLPAISKGTPPPAILEDGGSCNRREKGKKLGRYLLA